jgi:hypothetical protein
LQFLIFNEECLVSVSHQLALITSLPFVHTARRSYRLDDPVRFSDWRNAAGSPAAMCREVTQTLSSRGRRSRNKVSVGEPAEGSLPNIHIPTFAYRLCLLGPALRVWGCLRVVLGLRVLSFPTSRIGTFFTSFTFRSLSSVGGLRRPRRALLSYSSRRIERCVHNK